MYPSPYIIRQDGNSTVDLENDNAGSVIEFPEINVNGSLQSKSPQEDARSDEYNASDKKSPVRQHLDYDLNDDYIDAVNEDHGNFVIKAHKVEQQQVQQAATEMSQIITDRNESSSVPEFGSISTI